jgi:asparagine N-glycosylation enzyme membrane subunit Stt3
MSLMSTQTMTVARRRRRGIVLLGATYAWIAGHFTPFTWGAAIVTFVPGALGVVAGMRLPGLATRRRDLRRIGWVVWLAVLAAIVALEALSFFLGSSEAGHPTISNIVNHGLHTTTTRALGFFGWMAFGSWLLSR